MPKHYRLKAEPIEIIADATLTKLLRRAVRSAFSWLRWQAARLLRLRKR